MTTPGTWLEGVALPKPSPETTLRGLGIDDAAFPARG